MLDKDWARFLEQEGRQQPRCVIGMEPVAQLLSTA